jgi:hypothetical protein
MKAMYTSKNNCEKQAIHFSKINVIISIVFSASFMCAQGGGSFKAGLSAGAYTSGNAHGTTYDVSATLYNGTHQLSLGPCIQNRKPSVCGLRFGYSYILTGQESYPNNRFEKANEYNPFQLFAFTKSQYIANGYLSCPAVRREEAFAANKSENNSNATEIKLSTVEACIGFGLNYKLTKNLVWSNYVGFGAYYHLNYSKVLYSEKTAPMLTLGTSLTINHFKD